MRNTPTGVTPNWSQLLADAVSRPGVLSSAYQQFWNYSVGNQLLAIFECMRRGLQPGPIHTFRGWLHLERHVKKGERAITLCLPVSVKRKERQHALQAPAGAKGVELSPASKQIASPESSERFTVFTFKPRWFVLAQTDGEPYVPTELPSWSESHALNVLNIARVDFTHTNGNCQGFARLRQVAVSPIARLPHKTLLHELAHVVLQHTLEGELDDHDRTPVSLREAEAESVALICCESLKLAGTAECRGYIQNWLNGQVIPDRSAQKIFKAADAILKAGYPDTAKSF